MFGLSTLKLAIMGAIVLVAFGAGWTTQGWRLDATIATDKAAYADNIQKITATGALAEKNHAVALAAVQDLVAQADTQHTKELADANAQISAARSAIATRAFRVRTACAAGSPGSGVLPVATTAASVGNGTPGCWAVVDAATAVRLLAVAAEADRTRVKLVAAQAYIAAIQHLGDKP